MTKKIRLNKEFYSADAVSMAKKAFEGFDIMVSEDKDYFVIGCDDKKALLEFVNYVLALS